MTKRGRPSRAQSLTRDQVLARALQLLQSMGPQAFSIRALGRELGITPMSVLYHVTDLPTLLHMLVEHVHGAPIALHSAHTPQEKVMALLTGYMQRVREHPALILCVFGSPALFTQSLTQLTQQLHNEIAHFEANPCLLRDLLVDYTNGYALSVALSPDAISANTGDFHATIQRLLATTHTT